MSRARPGARQLAVAAMLVLAAVAVLAGLLAPGRARSAPGGLPQPRPTLGVADTETVLMGAAPDGVPGEAWAYRRLPRDVGAPVVNGQPLELGPVANPQSPDPQLVFLRHTDATGWQMVQTPMDENGATIRGPIPNPLSARTTRAGGGLLMGRDPARAGDRQAVVMTRDPGSRFRVLPEPPPTVLLPAGIGDPAESLAGERGSGTVVVTAFDQNDKTAAYLAPTGRDAEDGILHWDGLSWTREPVQIPAGSESFFQITALSATSATNAWALAQTADALGRGIVLFQRVIQNNAPVWVERPLGSARFRNADTPALSITGVQALDGAADPLTATSAGVWIDLAMKVAGTPTDATIYFDPGAGPGDVTGSWCDVPSVCSQPLNAKISGRRGYRSFAWAGSGFGTRIITNPLLPGGDDETNRGTYLSLEGSRFVRRPGGGGNFRRSGAFASAADGWLEGPVRIGTEGRPSKLESWPLALRAPLAAVAPAPGAAAGSLDAGALAVGGDGGVERYTKAGGWQREFLLTGSGAVARPQLRGVAWPEPGRAHAVGDLGAMWLWRAETGLWERDPAAPVGFEANLMDVAFDPADPDRGYAVGKGGTLLRYGKTWEQEAVPGGLDSANFTQVAFAGRQALVAAGGSVLVNSGGGWEVDGQAKALLDTVRAGDPQIVSVAGLPDGGAVAGGRDVVIERDGGPGTPWRFADQPLPGSTVVALSAFRDGGRIRAVVSAVPQIAYPLPDILPPTDPNVPDPIIPPFGLPGDGYVLRETAGGWRDEEQAAFFGSGSDRPLKADPILAFDLDASGSGWAVGGWSGQADSAGRGSGSTGAQGSADRARVQTAGAYRYDPGGSPPGPPSAADAPLALPAGPIRLAVAGHAQCEAPCADLAPQGLGPDRTLAGALGKIAAQAGKPNGPRMLLYTGGRSKPGGAPQSDAEAGRYAELLGGQPGLPVYPAVGAGESAGGQTGAYESAFAGFSTPFGSGAAPAGVSTATIPGIGAGPGARTHYAFDSSGSGGTVRVIVIDNSQGSLAASDPYQNPAEAQRPWLASVLADAKARGIPAIVMGSRNLNPRITPNVNGASDGADVAKLLLDGGASAYVFDRPEENRAFRIPAGSATTIPAFGTGSLGYRSPIANSTSGPDALFGGAGYLLAEIDASKRDPATNRAPVTARLIPVIDDLALQATDGTLIRRSRVALFQGLGRRPVAGDRWGRAAGDGSPNPPGGDPYTAFPPAQCVSSGCSSRIDPQFTFTSSDPDLGDFVKQDPKSTNLRKPFQDAKGKVVTDSASGLFCAFNAGTTKVTIQAGGLSYTQAVTIQAGSVQQPCGTRPKSPDRFVQQPPASQPSPDSPPPPPAAAGAPPPLAPPPPPVVPPVAPVTPKPPAPLVTPTPLIAAAAAPLLATALPVPITGTTPPGYPSIARPIPPGGAVARVYQVEEKREEEAAPESSQAFARYRPNESPALPGVPIVAMIVVAAAAGATIRGARRGRGGGRRPLPATVSVRTRPVPSHRTARPRRRP